MLSISTAYNIDKKKSWEKLVSDVKSLGFDSVELNVEIPEKWMSDIEQSVNAGEIKISSLHNYCPELENLPEGRTIYSGFLLTSDNNEERELAVKYTIRTIDWAKRFNAKAVVIHAGEVHTDPSGREFIKYIQQFGRNGKLYKHYENALMLDRKKKSSKYMENLYRSLDKILSYMSDKDILLGLENRFYYHEIPNIEEVLQIIDKFSGAPIGYWHDTGHAEIFVRNGWVKRHLDFLEPLYSRLIGMHLHDLREFSDHFAPGSGDFDFSILKPYISQNTIMVVEAHQKSTFTEVKEGINYLRKTGFIF